MPFTVSHVAAILPGYRLLSRTQVWSAAVVGSMVPDFGFLLLPGSLARWQTHSALALFTFCLPVGLATYWVLQLFIKPALLQILPDRAYVRLKGAQSRLLSERPSEAFWTLRVWLYASIAILIGALTHLIWDGFTHENAHGVLMFPVLDEYGPDLDGHPVQFYHWLQYCSSVIGLLVLAFALVRWWRNTPQPALAPQRALGPAERLFWSMLYVLVPLTVMLAWAVLHAHRWEQLRSALFIGFLAVQAMRGCAVSLLLVSALVRGRVAGAHAVGD